MGGSDAGGPGAAVVLLHAVFPLEEVGDGLRLDANFYAAQAGQQQIHFVSQASRCTQVAGGTADDFDLALANFQESPAWRQVFDLQQS